MIICYNYDNLSLGGVEMKELFLKLNKAKQKKIVEAGVEEFSKQLFNDASINQIIKKAGIARGSFYLYFDDKLDFYCYLMDTIFEKKTITFAIELFKSKQIDFLGFFRELFKFNLRLLTNDEHKRFFRNLYLGINKEVKEYLDQKRKKVRESLIQKALDLIPEKLTANMEQLNELIIIIQLIQMDLFVKGIANNISNETLLAVYDFRISLLKIE